MLTVPRALAYTFAMGAVILFCRAVPFLFFRNHGEGQRKKNFTGTLLSLAEQAAPPAAMTVLAFNAITGPVKEDPLGSIPVLIAAGITALIHIWKRNSLLSIFGGTVVYMVLERIR
ncbi:MAG: AzlD domain-containing protein [Spirochaetaceae bacterium]|jgi:branched-subunit amino acid transport protein AzlD|nr:AzlD domain-containing protein [Spirochaetaceae bacterium]